MSLKKIALIGALLSSAALGGCATIDTGYRGVVLNFNKPTGEIKSEGLYFYNPIGTEIVPMNVQTVAASIDSQAVSSDQQPINTTVTVNYHLDPGHVPQVYDRLRTDYEQRIIGPSVLEVTKRVTAKYTATQLITQREAARQLMETDLRQYLAPYFIDVDQVLITNFAFSKEYMNSVESKVIAKQNLETTITDARSAYEKAAGEARAQATQKQSLTPLMIQKLFLDKWDGHLPTVTGGQTMMNLKDMIPQTSGN